MSFPKQVWLYDNREANHVKAMLQPMTDAHIDRANVTWVPEFHRRRQLRANDQDYLVWDWPSKDKYLLASEFVGIECELGFPRQRLWLCIERRFASGHFGQKGSRLGAWGRPETVNA